MTTFAHDATTDYRSSSSAPYSTSPPSLSSPHPTGFVAECIIWRVRMTSNPLPPHSRHKNEPAKANATTSSETTPATRRELRRLVSSILDPQRWHVPLGTTGGHQAQTQPASRSAVKRVASHSKHWHSRDWLHNNGGVLLLICADQQTEDSSVAMAPFSSSSSSVSSSVVFVMPRAEPASLSQPTKMKKQATNNRREAALRQWNFVCDVVAQMLLLPMVCVGVCGAVGLLLGLECMEKLQRRRLPFLKERQQQHKRRNSHHHSSATCNCIAGANVNPDQKERDEGRDDDADARRPLKKQRSSADNRSNSDTSTTSSSSTSDTSSDAYAANNSCSGNPLETQPLVHIASSKRKTPAVTRKRRVFIWDLDETLVLFASLYTGAFAQSHGKEIATGVQLGEQMMTFMLTMLERHFFFNDLHDADIDHIHCLRNGVPGGGGEASAAAGVNLTTANASPLTNLAARYERIREIYEREGAVDFLSDERSEWFAIREALVAAIDAFSTGWLQEARHVLELLASGTSKTKNPTTTTMSAAASSASSSNAPVVDGEASVEYENINLMVTNTQLAPALCKCLIYQLDAFFPIESVYSSSKVHKQHCFEQILRTYTADSSSSDGDESDSVEFIAIGDGAEEEHVSRALGIQFHKIRSLADLKRLRFDLQLEARDERAVGM